MAVLIVAWSLANLALVSGAAGHASQDARRQIATCPSWSRRRIEGEEVILARGDTPVAKIVPIVKQAFIFDILA